MRKLILLVLLHHPRLAGASLLLTGCALAGVVGFQFFPMTSLKSWTLPVGAEEKRSQELSEKYRILNEFNEQVEQLSADLIFGRTNLKAAVQELEQSEKVKEAYWIEMLQTVYSADSASASLACALIQHVRLKVSNHKTPRGEATLQRLAAEYRAAYGTELVLPPLLAEAESDTPGRLRPVPPQQRPVNTRPYAISTGAVGSN